VTDDVRGALPPEVEKALLVTDALNNALACYLAEAEPDCDLSAFFDEIAVLEELAAEKEQEFERVRREHGIED
jgi:hypothetical protein